jgi:glycosyltransferase EpsF
VVGETRILHVLPGLGAAGCETFVRNLVLGLRDEPQLTQEIAVSTLPEQFYEPELQAAGIVIHRTDELGGVRSVFKHTRALTRLLKEKKHAGAPFDVVHCHMDYLNAFNLFAAFRAGVPRRICHSHIAGSQAQNPSIITKFYRAVMRIGIRLFATDCAACSPEAAASMFWKRRAAVIPNGIDVARFAAVRGDADQRRTMRRALGLDDIQPVALIVAGMREQKNPLFAVDIVAEIWKRLPRFVLIWCGGGSELPQIKARIAQYGIEEHVLLLGSRRDIPAIMCAADCLILPSKWEGFGIVLVEAQSAGLPCFASEHTPRSANMGACVYLPIDSVDCWANAVTDGFLHGFNARVDDKILRNYDIKTMCDCYKTLLETRKGDIA